MAKLQFFGAAGTVTGSNHLFTDDKDKSIMVDFGMFQGTEEVNALNKRPLSFNPADIDNVVLTHAHLDHCGRLPMLAKGGFKGSVYMTEPTANLAEIVMYDSAKIAQIDNDRDPLYTEIEVEKLLTQFRVVDYDKEFDVGDAKVVLRDAGHLLGSASADIRSGNKHVVFSGDIGNSPSVLLGDLQNVPQGETVIIESTYGDRLHPKEDVYKEMASEIVAVEKDKSVLLLPAFSLERTQMLLYMIKELKRRGKVAAETRVFMDSPMAIRTTEVYKTYTGLFNSNIRKEFEKGDPFDFPGLSVTMDSKKSRGIKSIPGPKIIIAGAGMMNGGRIVTHARNYLPRSSTRLLFVGYQGVDTLGREIQEGAKQVEIDGKMVPVRAKISRVDSLSAHADWRLMLDWLSKIKGVKKVFLVHGEDGGPREIFAKKIKDELGVEVFRPTLDQEFRI